MSTLSERLVKCPEAGCVRRGAHEFHSDGKGRTWAFRDPYRPAWLGYLRAKELTR